MTISSFNPISRPASRFTGKVPVDWTEEFNFSFGVREGTACLEFAFTVKPQHHPLITAEMHIYERISNTIGHHVQWKHGGPRPGVVRYADQEFPVNGASWKNHCPSLEHLGQQHVLRVVKKAREAWRKYAEEHDFIEYHHRFCLYCAAQKNTDTIVALQILIDRADHRRRRAVEVFNSGNVTKVVDESEGKLWEETFG